MEIDLHSVKYYTDSKIVLGYINNASRRFHVYVSNRVVRIRKSTNPEQWHHIATTQNPADNATRPVSVAELQNTNWLTGPAFLRQTHVSEQAEHEVFNLIDPESDKEIRPEITALATKVNECQLGSHRFSRFSSWKSLVRGVAILTHTAKTYSGSAQKDCKGWHCCKMDRTVNFAHAETTIIKCVQQEIFQEEFKSLYNGEKISSQSTIRNLNPILDEDGLIRVGGRLSNADITEGETHPLIIPANHHISTLLIKHYHEKVVHQGRHFTECARRTAGLWIIRAKKLVSKIIKECVICKKLRGLLQVQKTSDLLKDRLNVAPPFTYVGLDVFGPWNVVSRRTRAGSAESKRWAVMFTCLCTRAVHLEILESMSSSS